MYTLIVIGVFSISGAGVATPVVNVPNLSYQECVVQGNQITTKMNNARRSDDAFFSCLMQADK